MSSNRSAAPARRSLPLLLVAALAAAAARAQEPAPVDLAPVSVAATRTPVDAAASGSAVDVLEAADWDRAQLPVLRGVLALVPGAPALSAGAAGASTSLFLRGANSNQALFLVDGIRFNDPNTDYAVALGGVAAGAHDRIEVARGPQSTLYGSEAVGGVVALQAERGRGAPSGTLRLEAGAFGTLAAAVAGQGADGPAAVAFDLTVGHTDNARPNNAFTTASGVLRVDRDLGATAAVGLTWRGFGGRYGDPGDRFTNDPDNRDTESNQLVTVFADFGRGTDLASHVVVGGQDRRFVSDNPGPGGGQVTVVRNRRAVLDWQTTWRAGAQRLTAGATGEFSHTVNTGFGDINRHEARGAVFVQDEWSPATGVHLTGGIRRDEFDTFGGATTGRLTAAWLPAGSAVKLRASYGSGFRAPGFLDLYGRSAFYVGNPNLRPETARGADAGADWYVAGGRGVLSATAFRTGLSNLINYDFSVFPGTVVNVARARTQGVEVAARWFAAGWKLRAAYTYLDATDETQATRLLRRPRHSGALDAGRDFGHGWSAGVGAAFVADRRDIDAATYDTVAQPGYTVVRCYAAWQATSRLAVRARLENLLDRRYEEINGYPLPGFGAYGGVEWRW